MTEQLQLRRGTAAQVAAFTGAQGEVVVDTTNNRLVVQDGATAGGFPAAKLAEVAIAMRRAVADAPTTIAATDRLVAFASLTASRAVTLCAASAYPTGTALIIVDESGNCSATDTIVVNRAGSDTIDGAASFTLNAAYASLQLESNGANAWTILSPTPSVIASLVGVGTAPDPSNPLSVYGPSALFNGASNMNVTVNKNGSANSASFIFEDGFSGRAQIGLTGDDNFRFKVSPNGSSWIDALDINATTGVVSASMGYAGSPDASYLRGYLGGLTLSNDSGSPNTVIDIAAGVACSDDFTTLMKTAALTKGTGSWAAGSGNGGLDVGSVLASTWYHIYLIERTDTNVVDALLSQAPGLSATLTATNASPCVFTWSGGAPLPFQNGAPFVLSGTTAPAGFTLGTQYFVVAANQAAGAFELSATPGGAAIGSTSTGAGLNGASAPQLPSPYSKKRRIGSILTDASSHILAFSQNGDEFIWSVPNEDINTSTLGTTATLFILSYVPPGVKVNALGRYGTSAVTTQILINSSDETSIAGGSLSPSDVQLNASAAAGPRAQLNIRTNTAQQVRAVATAASTTLTCFTYGWIDTRGRFS